eukprot:NODE_2030_length_2308_cov_14.290692.p1 GENE.NODE_2030_length_2308_cov_14.290692~~NODE_2030_length_2308_cov_14.290692.p1  ORF type:complete len:706 (+),score=208.91 NODE_2030_length_2308_cov_14.290692:3-2120(+)
MNRIRPAWSRVRRGVSAHFTEVASHPNTRVCVYAIDSLKQLAMHFLEKDELSNYHFQVEFLRPFEVVMSSTPGVCREVKDLIVSVISFMVQSRIQNIKSGWKTVFHILHTAAQEQGLDTATQSSFAIMETVIKQHHHLFLENFTDGVRTLLAFAQCKVDLAMSLQAITYLLQAAEHLATSPDLPKDMAATSPSPSHSAGHAITSSPTTPAMVTASVVVTGVATEQWFPILRGLSMLVSDPRRDVRAAALNGVFDCLRDYGNATFDEDTWRMVFNGVIKPLFDDIHHQLHDVHHQQKHGGDVRRPDSIEQQQGVSSGGSTGGGRDFAGGGGGAVATTPEGQDAATWGASMGPPTVLAALTALVRLFDAQLESLSFLLDDVLKLLVNCIHHDIEEVARIGVEVFRQLLLLTGKKLSADAWERVTATIVQLFETSLPTSLIGTLSNDRQLPFRKDDVVIQCVVQLLLIDMLLDIVAKLYEHIPITGVMVLLDALQKSYEFAQAFNQDIELRQELKRLGFMKEMKMLPGLLKQEREALRCSLKILFQVQIDRRIQNSPLLAEALDRLMSLCCAVLRNYVRKEQSLQEQSEQPVEGADNQQEQVTPSHAVVETERELLGLVPIISDVILRGLENLAPDRFRGFVVEIFPLLCDLTALSSCEVRAAVRDVFISQVSPMIVGVAGGSPEEPVHVSLAGAGEGGGNEEEATPT